MLLCTPLRRYCSDAKSRRCSSTFSCRSSSAIPPSHVPSTKTPIYFDFLHFALILGMTFQTADIDITSRAIRRVSTAHCLEAFIFNIGILAFSINMIAGG